MTEQQKKFECTSCGGDAFIAYSANEEGNDWNGLIKVGEKICPACGKKRGINFFGKQK